MADAVIDKLETLKEVGKASVEAMQYAVKQVKPGARLIDVANSAEKFLKDRGFGLAFPINLSVNSQAAHFTPALGDEGIFSENDIVKVDFGAERNGLLGDGAITVDVSGRYSNMVETAEKALDNAISMVKHGVSVCDIGKAIAETVEASGLKPIKNLGGHGIKEHDLHAKLFIPNYDNADFTVLEEGMVVAIEPFVTSGKGMITNSDLCEIYSYSGDANVSVRSQEARKLLESIQMHNSKEPFAVRWFSNIIDSKFRLYAAISELLKAGALEAHPTLVEVSGANVAQAEAQLIVNKDSCDIITRANR